MEKQKADVIIADYLQKIYGFAYKKSFSHNEAEEIAAEMTAEVYHSLRNCEEVFNVEGYIWRICEHTYSRYVSSVKRHEGVSIDEMADIPYYDKLSYDDNDEEIRLLKREIAFLSSSRREIVFRFYYLNEPIKTIAAHLHVPEGTVKWHLNKARNDLKEGMKMERKIGELGIHPVEATGFGHSGNPGNNGGPEHYLNDKLSLNIVYSVYFEPKTLREIAEELGVTPVYIEDKVNILESNGFIVKTKGDRFTTYVKFNPRKYSNEQEDTILLKKREAAEILVKEYVPSVIAAMADVKDVYIPSGNRELLEAAAVFYGIVNKCSFGGETFKRDLSKYYISDLGGGNYIASVSLKTQCTDPDYKVKMNGEYWACGNMWRSSDKYHSVKSWAMDSRFDTREGTWENNLYTDYEYLYELMTGRLIDRTANAEKIRRLKKRKFIDENDKVQIIVYKGDDSDFYDRIPKCDDKLIKRFVDFALENAMQVAKQYPPQMQDLVVSWSGRGFIDQSTAVMALEMLYENGTFKPLTPQERITANLIMFSDVLPE